MYFLILKQNNSNEHRIILLCYGCKIPYMTPLLIVFIVIVLILSSHCDGEILQRDL